MLVEAIENAFVPLLIHNNRPGKDAQVLKRFGEPSWNYQVVRFLTPSGKDLIPRKDRVWTSAPLIRRMIEALKAGKQPIPGYLQALAEASRPPTMNAQVALAMHCFWTGELKLGQMDGVLLTEAGWIDGHEVTLVTYDPKRLTLGNLVRQAASVGCAHKVFLERKASGVKGAQIVRFAKDYRKARASDQGRQMQGTAFTKLDLLPTQATKVNAWARVDPKKALECLSPAQKAQLR